MALRAYTQTEVVDIRNTARNIAELNKILSRDNIKLKEENDELKEEIDKLQEEIEKLKKKKN